MLSVFVKFLSIITVIAFLWHTPIVNTQGKETKMGDNMMTAQNSVSSVPDRYTKDETKDVVILQRLLHN